MKTINCVGLPCPKPVIETKKYFEGIEKGEAIVIVDNEVANTNVTRFAENSGFSVKSVEEDGLFKLTISKKSEQNKEDKKDTFSIVISTDKMGEGDDALGKILMKSYMYALSESSEIPEELVFLNGGVKLVTEGTEVLDSIKELERKGTKIISCGTCLDFYGLKDKLLTGEVSNMYTIVEIMNSKRIVKI
ncbi:selenium metabolism protein YedF [Clostridium moniliforme]|uniref:Selenium metabolism protein YedF n=1 Tax=Clostridium moniliforme TaxID=39489 RepID=A0ABS4F348_9CLOT|nr:sulfurtransferase-like selenium metabolism protein YedF [Clostridium moniliforme]MBP1890677.1 selenium metabolism protein YedF [Clostridium moniliforme]